MDIYWIAEYGKVLAGYIFLMFIWPSVVFKKFLKNKERSFCFSFCVTVQICLVNAVVLTLGLLHILDNRLVVYIFLGIFIIAVCKMDGIVNLKKILLSDSDNKVHQIYEIGIVTVKRMVKSIRKLWADIRAGFWEYIILLIVISFGVIYFSYGAFQIHVYGFTDMFIHHRWVNSLVEGHIFSEGIYPQAMHCFVYCMHVLFGIKIYSIIKFLQCIHIVVFLISSYFFLREIFYWKYSPVFVMGLYLTINFSFEYSMSRLQVAFPMEFGFYTQFLCVLYLVRYLKKEDSFVWKGKNLKDCWNKELLLFMLALTASIEIHFYITVMAFILCFSFSIFSMRQIFVRKKMIPLLSAIICGCVIAMLPMAGAYISGIPLEGSLYWGVNSVSPVSEENSHSAQDSGTVGQETVRGPLDLADEDLKIIEKLPDIGQKIVQVIIKSEYLIKETYKKGYQGMYSAKRGKRIFDITIVVIGIYFIGKFGKGRLCDQIRKASEKYPPIILLSFVSVLLYAAYAAPELGLPVLISDHRFCAIGHLMILSVMIMPADILFSIGILYCKEKFLQYISVLLTLGIYVMTNLFGIYHKYLYFVLSQYDVALSVTNSIIEEFPKNSFTLIAPDEEKPLITLYGRHEEIWGFLETCAKGSYSIPTKYIFIYVEKRPIEYYQSYSFDGPLWLGKGKKTEIKASNISVEAAQEDMSEFDSWYRYGQGRTILESHAYEWCQDFSQKYPSELGVYYEDENFVCYYIKQNADMPYELGIQED